MCDYQFSTRRTRVGTRLSTSPVRPSVIDQIRKYNVFSFHGKIVRQIIEQAANYFLFWSLNPHFLETSGV